tara:strand:- start:43 stop:261 length:219 start_codon:yes stop_codon:yes gene_type:complete
MLLTARALEKQFKKEQDFSSANCGQYSVQNAFKTTKVSPRLHPYDVCGRQVACPRWGLTERSKERSKSRGTS